MAEEREGKSRAGSQGCYSVLFVAATHCYRVVAAWRRSSPLFLSLFSLSPTLANSPLALSYSVTCSLPHRHCLCTSALLLPPLCVRLSHRWLVTIRILISSMCCSGLPLELPTAVNLSVSCRLRRMWCL